jgi:hypothetical protein
VKKLDKYKAIIENGHGIAIPVQAQRVPEGCGSQFAKQSAHEGDRFVSLTAAFTLRTYPCHSFLLEAESTPGP